MKKLTNDIQRMKYLVDEITRHNFLYHTLDSPEISDDKYDSLLQELKDLEQLYPDKISKDSPTKQVGSSVLPMFMKVTRDKKMYSLDKTNSLETLNKFINDVTFSMGEFHPIYVDAKLDGLAIELTYKNAELVLATTRGNGYTGEVVTENAKNIRGIPQQLQSVDNVKLPELLQIRGEVVMHKSDFNNYNKLLLSEGLEPLANPRSAAAGTIRQLNSNITKERILHFYAYGIGSCIGIEYKTHTELLASLVNMKFAIPPVGKLCYTIEEVHTAIREIGLCKRTLPMECDGAVLIFNERDLYDILGYTEKFPKYACSYKYPTDIATTRLLEIKQQVGRTGVITPVAIIEPVKLAGVTVARATLHNWDEINRLDIHNGDTIFIKRSNDVIPKIIGTDPSKRVSSVKVITPTNCPNCNTPLIKFDGGSLLYCINPDCLSRKIRSICHFVSKPCANIAEFGIKTAAKLLTTGLIKDQADIFGLTQQQLIDIGFGHVESANLINAITTAKHKLTLSNFINSLGIQHVGESASKTLGSKFNNMTEFMESVLDEQEWRDIVENSYDIGKTIARSVEEYFTNPDNIALINKFEAFGVWPVSESSIVGKLSDVSFVITGKLSKSRDDIKQIIRSHGGKVNNAITKDTDYLISGESSDKAVTSIKILQAKKYNINIITEQQFMDMIK